MKRLALLFALVPCIAFAGTMTVRWTPPTQNVDGSTIPASGPGSLTEYRLQWGQCVSGGFGTVVGEQIVPAPASSYTVQNIPPGTWCARVYARNTYAAESAASNTATKVIAAPVPNPPVLTIDTTARLWKRGLMQKVGTVNLGVVCGAQKQRQWHVVSRDNVTLKRPVSKNAVIVARCA